MAECRKRDRTVKRARIGEREAENVTHRHHFLLAYIEHLHTTPAPPFPTDSAAAPGCKKHTHTHRARLNRVGESLPLGIDQMENAGRG